MRLEWSSRNHLVQLHCSKEGQLEKVSWGYVQSGFEYIQEWDLHNITGQFLPAFDDSPCKNFCLTFKWNFLYFDFHSPPLLLSLGTTEKGLLCLSIHQVFIDIAQILLNFLSFMPNSHSSLSFCLSDATIL